MKLRFALLILFGFLTASALAYGPIGHQIVGAIADGRLANTSAGAKIRDLLDGFTLEKAAVVPDEIKGWDKNGPDDPDIFHYSSRPRIDQQLRDFWKANPPTRDATSPIPSHHWFHYTDVPIATPQKYGDGKAGRTQWDIVHMMRYCIAVLKGDEPEENARKITRPIAIILLAHFAGDIHQPLHVGAEFFDPEGRPADPDKVKDAIEDQGGNTITLRHSLPGASKEGTSKLHGFWDNQTVMANLPTFPESMPKEERRAKTDEARDLLIARFLVEEPKNWRMPNELSLAEYPEAWANDILPVAREAHERLRFRDVRPTQQEGQLFASGFAEGKSEAGGVTYEDWAAGVVHDELHKAGWRLADLLEKALQ